MVAASGFGVGVIFNSTVPEFLKVHPHAVDYVELIPETLWTDRGSGRADRYVEVPAAVEQLDALAARLPIVCHGIGLSIGSTLALDEAHLLKMREVVERWNVSRFSEHLGFTRVAAGDGADRHIGLGLPLPCDEDVLEWLSARVSRAMQLLGMPIILENGVRHTPYVEEDMSEPVFLNRLAAGTGCGVLLDLHNLHVDCRNNGWLPDAYLDELDLRNVREIHMAGGSVVGDAYTDSHAGPSPEEVWELLHRIGPRCENLEGVTFEFHDSYYPSFGEEALCLELSRLSDFWRMRDRHVA